MKDTMLLAFIIGIVIYVGKAVMLRLVLGKRFHHWLTATPFRLGIMDAVLSVLGTKVLLSVHAEGLMALVVLTGFGACTTVYILYILTKRKSEEVWNAFF